MVQRDFRSAATFNRFFVADNRDETSRELEPEFYDTKFCQNRAASLSPGPDLPCFGLASRPFGVSSFVDVVLDDGAVHHQVRIYRIFFAGAEYGLSQNHEVHAGDLVVVCTAPDDSEAGRIVGRHWLPPFLDGFVWLLAGGGQHDPTTILAVHPGARAGVSNPPLVGARRAVEDDAAFGVPRTIHVVVAFYSDDFICRLGRNVSAGAVYMFYPGWMVGDRVGRHAVRTISVTPRCSCSDDVLRAITEDLTMETTRGWLLKDCDGHPVRVLLDVAFFVADYVQVSKSSQLRGHQALASCSRCGFTKSSGEGSQYVGALSAADDTMRRTTPRTAAVLQAVRTAWE